MKRLKVLISVLAIASLLLLPFTSLRSNRSISPIGSAANTYYIAVDTPNIIYPPPIFVPRG